MNQLKYEEGGQKIFIEPLTNEGLIKLATGAT
jgi:hypothetical protein